MRRRCRHAKPGNAGRDRRPQRPDDVLVTEVTAGGVPAHPAVPRQFASDYLAGVDVALEIGAGLPHVYPIMLGTPEAAEATEQIGKFLRALVR